MPVLIILSLLVLFTSKGGAFYLQSRVGKGGKLFSLIKFRSMSVGADKKGLLTVGSSDLRITRTGRFLRRYKLDELPQLFNVLKGDMSFVGPRPEVQKYVDLYTTDQKKVLEVRPGITDMASIQFYNENELLGKSDNPEALYVEEIMPEKLRINLEYIEKRSLSKDIRVILKTIGRMFGG